MDRERLGELATEARDPETEGLDRVSTGEMLAMMHRGDRRAAEAVGEVLPAIAAVVDAVAERFGRGGRLFFLGAGTSGRLGVLDASECPPTFSVEPGLFVGVIAGGDGALRRSSEGVEDRPEAGARDLQGFGLRAVDTVVGIAASGRTPYVLGALGAAREAGCLTVGVACVVGSEIGRAAAMRVEVATGAEVVTGSTRMKAGTATKMVLNMISTGVMVRMGAVYGNLMVNVAASNGKLVDRAERILVEATGCSRERAAQVLGEAGGVVKVGIVMERLGVSGDRARELLVGAGGRLRDVVG